MIRLSRKVVFAAIVLAWVAGMGFLVKREYFKSSALRLEEGAGARGGPGAGHYNPAHGGVEGDPILPVQIAAGASRPQRQRIRLQRPLVLPELISLRLAVGGELRP